MITPEKFGKFLLLEEIERSGLGSEYRAARLGPSGPEAEVSLLRLNGVLSSNLEAAKSLIDEVRFAAQLKSPSVVRASGAGRVDTRYYILHELVEGRSLRVVCERLRRQGSLLTLEQALLIASKVCSALEYAHARNGLGGEPYFHGLLSPAQVLVSYDGEVRVRGFGYWPSGVRKLGALAPEDALYLAPEQIEGGLGDSRSDVFAVGAILFEMLSGQRLLQGRRSPPIEAQISQARLPRSPTQPIAESLGRILRRSAAREPGDRYPAIRDMRKAIDVVLFSGDFAPTTFNLAYFMHSLFREEIERAAGRPEPKVIDSGTLATEVQQTRAAVGAPPIVQPAAPASQAAVPGPSRASTWPPRLPLRGTVAVEAPPLPPVRPQQERHRSAPIAIALLASFILGGGALYYFLAMPPLTRATRPAAEPATVSILRTADPPGGEKSTPEPAPLNPARAAATARPADDREGLREFEARTREAAAHPVAVPNAPAQARKRESAGPRREGADRHAMLGKERRGGRKEPAAIRPPPPDESRDPAGEAVPSAPLAPVPVILTPAPATTPALPPAASLTDREEIDRQRISSVVQRYARALESADLPALKALWPGMGAAEESRIRESFRFTRSLRVDIARDDLQLSGDTAILSGRRRDEMVSVDGDKVRSERSTTFLLRHKDGSWVIEGIR